MPGRMWRKPATTHLLCDRRIDDDYIRYVSQILGEGESVTCYVSYAYVEQDGRYFQAKVYSEDTSLGNAYCADLTTGESYM